MFKHPRCFSACWVVTIPRIYEIILGGCVHNKEDPSLLAIPLPAWRNCRLTARPILSTLANSIQLQFWFVGKASWTFKIPLSESFFGCLAEGACIRGRCRIDPEPTTSVVLQRVPPAAVICVGGRRGQARRPHCAPPAPPRGPP